MVLTDPKSKNFLCRPAMTANILKTFVLPIKKSQLNHWGPFKYKKRHQFNSVFVISLSQEDENVLLVLPIQGVFLITRTFV